MQHTNRVKFIDSIYGDNENFGKYRYKYFCDKLFDDIKRQYVIQIEPRDNLSFPLHHYAIAQISESESGKDFLIDRVESFNFLSQKIWGYDVAWIPREIEISIDWKYHPDLKRYMRQHLNLKRSRKGRPYKRTDYIGKRRSNSEIRHYDKEYKGVKVHRTELIIREKALKRLGVESPGDLMTVDWIDVIKKRVRFVDINWTALKKELEDEDIKNLFNVRYSRTGISGLKAAFEKYELKFKSEFLKTNEFNDEFLKSLDFLEVIE